jgi:hypothetical protein
MPPPPPRMGLCMSAYMDIWIHTNEKDKEKENIHTNEKEEREMK